MKINQLIIPMAVALTTAHIQGAITSSSFAFTSSTTAELQLTGDLSGMTNPAVLSNLIFVAISDPTYNYVNGLPDPNVYLLQYQTTETNTNILFPDQGGADYFSVVEKNSFFGNYLIFEANRDLTTADNLTGTYTMTLPSGYTFTPTTPMTWTYHVNWGGITLMGSIYNDTLAQIASGSVGVVPESSTTLIASCSMLSLLLKRRRAC